MSRAGRCLIGLAAAASAASTAAQDGHANGSSLGAGPAPAERPDLGASPVSRRGAAYAAAPALQDLAHRRDSAASRCGARFGTRCQTGDCCSSEGWCGQGYLYCSSPACQIDYSDGCDGNIRPHGPDTEDVPRPHIGPVPYGQGVYHCQVYGDIALSFDDGPFSYTDYLLDLLASYQAKATFFVTGRNLGKGAINDPSKPWRALVRRMIRDGHQVASHTWSHQRLTLLSREQLRKQMLYNEVALADILGFFPTYMRPPYSASNAEVDGWLAELGYHVTYFNLDTEGYLHDSPALIQQSKQVWDDNVEAHDPRTTKWLQIEHDTVYQAVHNLTEYMLKSLFRNGFRSVTVGECLGDAPKNWYRGLSDHQPPPRSTDGRCGRQNGGATCRREPAQRCCSRHGWCGSTADHCGAGCQTGYGTCSNEAQGTL